MTAQDPIPCPDCSYNNEGTRCAFCAACGGDDNRRDIHIEELRKAVEDLREEIEYIKDHLIL